MFELHPRLAEDCFVVTDLPLCRLLLMNDSNYPWLILVPRREHIREIFELSDSDQQQLIRESSQVSKVLLSIFAPDKINVAALGNMVPQLHIHHIARYTSDAAWPAPVWGNVTAVAYGQQQADSMIATIRKRVDKLPA